MSNTPIPRTEDAYQIRDGESYDEYLVRKRKTMEQLETELAKVRKNANELIASQATENIKLTEQRDTLAEALRAMKKLHSELWDEGYVADAAIATDKALAAVKGDNHE